LIIPLGAIGFSGPSGTYRLTQKKKFATPPLTPTNRPQTSKNRTCERRKRLGNYQR